MRPRPRPVGRRAGLLLLVAGCSTGKDAVATGGTFQFVAPGGQTEITYRPAVRPRHGRGGGRASLADPAKTLALADYAGKVVVINLWGSWCGPAAPRPRTCSS